MAEALPPGGRIITCDISEEHVAIARKHIGGQPVSPTGSRSGSGPAIETLASLDGPFDLVFIDADKPATSTTTRRSCPSWRRTA